MLKQGRDKLFTKQFVLLCLGSLFFFASFTVIIPELPDHITQLGGEKYKGLIISLFAFASLIVRPLSGKLADEVGRLPIIAIGALISALSGVFYIFAVSVIGFLSIRAIHGFSAGFTPTGTVAYVSDIVPATRRAEALGMLGLMSGIGRSIGPALGSEIAHSLGMNWLFITCSIFAVLSIILVVSNKETITQKKKFRVKELSFKPKNLIERRVFAPSFVMMLYATSFGSVQTIVPDFAKYLGLEKQGYFFLVFTLTSILIRLISGRASDKIGRVIMLIFGSILCFTGFVLLALATNLFGLYNAAIVLGLAAGINGPILFAWCIDLADENHKAKATSTLFIALELGVIIGALASSGLYQNNAARFPIAFSFFALIMLISLFYLILRRRKNIRLQSSKLS